MRNGTSMAFVLAVCVTGCGEGADPEPTAAPSSEAAPSEAAISTAPVETAAPAPAAAEAANAPSASAVPDKLRALGTEPFWNAQISGGALTYTTPENQRGQSGSVIRRETPGGTEFSGKLGDAAIHLMVTKQTCSDGMSDRSYPFTVVLTLGGDRRDGCAS
jgi:uncharacterized membrane protein